MYYPERTILVVYCRYFMRHPNDHILENELFSYYFAMLRDVGLDAQWSSQQKDFQNAYSKELVISSSSPETIMEVESENIVKGYLSKVLELLSTCSVANVTC